jgi:predicted PurR-regulated permease PerM
VVHRRGSSVALVVASAIVIAAGIKLAAPLLSQLVLAAFLATMTAPLVLGLQRRRVPLPLAIGAGVLLDVALVIGLVVFVAGSVTAFSQRLPMYEERLSEFGAHVANSLLRYGVDVSLAALREIVDPAVMVDMARSLVQSVAELLSRILIMLLMVAFMLIEAVSIERKLLRVVEDREDLRDLSDGVGEVYKYLYVKSGTSAATGALVALWCWVCGVDLPILWGLLAFLLNYIPNIGSIIAAVPAILLALVQHGPGTAMAVGAGYLAVNFIIGNMLEPRWMGRALGLSSLVVFLSMLVWGWLLGPVGALFSAPLTMMLKHWLEHTEDLAWIAVLLSPAGETNPVRPSNPDAVPPTPG